jgi:hypothetical protein
VRTVVISDLHLGTHRGRDVLRRPEPREPLLESIAGCERLVLLGDVVEFRHGPVRDALADAAPVLASLGEALGSGGEVVIVPGNHDHHLLDRWLERRARKAQPPPMGLDEDVDWRAGDPLASVVRALSPAAVRVSYPGVWLREDVYATHGHYVDRHTTVPMFERLGAGLMARVIREPSGGPQCVDDYEGTLSPIYAWVHAIAQAGRPDLKHGRHGPSARAWRMLANSDGRRSLKRRGMIAAFPALIAVMSRAGLGPLHHDLSGAELRAAALRAFGEVCTRLHVDAEHVIFGHTHRAGPLPGDDVSEWRTPAGARLLNTGCWVHEPDFLGPRPLESPYRPGFAAVVEDSEAPQLTPLLDEISLQARV